MVKQSQDKQLAQLLKKHKDFVEIQTGKIRCELTSHEMNNVKQLKEYIKGKAYKRALEGNFEVTEYSQHLKPYRNDPRFLFCTMTGSKVVNKKSVIEKHINGKKYKRTLQRLQKQRQIELQKQQVKKAKKQQRAQQQSKIQQQQDVLDQIQDEEEEEQKPVKVAKKTIKKTKKITKPVKPIVTQSKVTTSPKKNIENKTASVSKNTTTKVKKSKKQ